MQVTIDIPEDLAQVLASGTSELAKTTLESVALEGIRSGKLSEAQARRLLGISSRYEMDGFLKAHDIYPPMTLEDVLCDAETSRAFRSK